MSDKNTYGKTTPKATDAEEALLGALLLEKDKLTEVMAILPTSEMFYKDANQHVYQSILNVKATGENVDSITVTQELKNMGKLEEVGGAYAVSKLTMDVVTSAHAETHARIIAAMFIKRETIRVCGEGTKEAYETGTDPIEVIQNIHDQLLSAAHVRATNDWKSMQQANVDLTKHMDEVKGKTLGVTTGFAKLDKTNGGLPNGSLTVIGARPSVGKSALMGCMALAAGRQGCKVGIISLEMPTVGVYGRMVSSASGIGFKKINTNDLEDVQLQELSAYMDSLVNLPIYFSDTAKVNIRDIEAKAYKLKKKHGLGILFIDYIQLVEGIEKRQVREQVVSQISRGLKTLAMVLDIPIVALAQLNRESEKEKRKPRSSDFRESGALEQDADIVMLLHRDWRMGVLADEHGNSTEKEADLIIPKWRNGETLTVELHFEPETMTFSEPQSEIESQFNNPRAGMGDATRGVYNKNEKPFGS